MRSTLTIAVLLLCCTQVQAQDAMQQRIEVLERKVRVISELVIRLDRLQREVQQLRGEVEVQNHALESMKQRQRDLYLDLDSRLSQSSGSGAPQGSPPTGSGNAQPPGGASVSMPGSSVTEVEPRKGTPSKASPEEELGMDTEAPPGGWALPLPVGGDPWGAPEPGLWLKRLSRSR